MNHTNTMPPQGQGGVGRHLLRKNKCKFTIFPTPYSGTQKATFLNALALLLLNLSPPTENLAGRTNLN